MQAGIGRGRACMLVLAAIITNIICYPSQCHWSVGFLAALLCLVFVTFAPKLENSTPPKADAAAVSAGASAVGDSAEAAALRDDRGAAAPPPVESKATNAAQGSANQSAPTKLVDVEGGPPQPASARSPSRSDTCSVTARRRPRPAFHSDELVIEHLDDPGDEYNVSPRTAYLRTPPASPLGSNGARKSLLLRARPSHLRRESAELSDVN